MDINAGNLALIAQMVDVRFNQGMQRAVTPFDFMAMDVSSTTAENIYPYLKDMGGVREWIGDRVVQNLASGDFRIRNKSWEETHGIDRKDIEDDNYGLYGPMFEQLGQNVQSMPSEQLYGMLKTGFTTLGPDGQYFFDVDHPVAAGQVSNFMGGSGEAWFIVDGSKVFKPLIRQPRKPFQLVKLFNETDPNVFFQRKFIFGVDGRVGFGYSPFWQLAFANKNALDATQVRATLTAMASQKGDSGKPLKTAGTHIVVSPTLAEVANDLFGKEYLANGETNTMKGRLTVVSAPELL